MRWSRKLRRQRRPRGAACPEEWAAWVTWICKLVLHRNRKKPRNSRGFFWVVGGVQSTKDDDMKKTPQATAPDAIALLKEDHRAVAALFEQFDKAGDGAKA